MNRYAMRRVATRHMAVLSAAVLGLWATAATAEVKSKAVTYDVNGESFVGYLAWDDAVEGARPGVLVVHEWWGLNDYAKQRVEQLAQLGYTAFAPDMYGKGKVTEHAAQAKEWATQVRQNQDAWRARAAKGLEVLASQPQCDPQRLAAIGYCFGGSTVLQLAYSGADLKAVVSFHGALMPPTAEQAKQLKSRILICHGAADGFIPEEVIRTVKKALTEAGADWDMIYYGGAQHSFTVPGADAKKLPGIAYDAAADRRSWRHMQSFLTEALSTQK